MPYCSRMGVKSNYSLHLIVLITASVLGRLNKVSVEGVNRGRIWKEVTEKD